MGLIRGWPSPLALVIGCKLSTHRLDASPHARPAGVALVEFSHEKLPSTFWVGAHTTPSKNLLSSLSCTHEIPPDGWNDDDQCRQENERVFNVPDLGCWTTPGSLSAVFPVVFPRNLTSALCMWSRFASGLARLETTARLRLPHSCSEHVTLALEPILRHNVQFISLTR